MTIEETMKSRHMVRKLPQDVVDQLMARIYENNEKDGLRMKLQLRIQRHSVQSSN